MRESSTSFTWSNLLSYFYLVKKKVVHITTKTIGPTSVFYGGSLQSCNFCNVSPIPCKHDAIKNRSPHEKYLHTTVQNSSNLDKARERVIAQLMQTEAQGYNYLNSDAC